MTKPDTSYFSPSRVVASIHCERYHHAKYVRQLPDTPHSVELVVGATLDEVLSDLVGGYLLAGDRDSFVGNHDLHLVRAVLDRKTIEAEATGASWMQADSWDPETMARKCLDLIDRYWRDRDGTEWVATQTELSGELWGHQFYGILDAVYLDPTTSDEVIVDWKSKKRRDPMDFLHKVQLSLYAHMRNVKLIEAHYLVPWTKDPGFVIHRTARMPREILEPFVTRQRVLEQGAEPTLNPSSRVCSEKYCPAWGSCPVSTWKEVAVESYSA